MPAFFNQFLHNIPLWCNITGIFLQNYFFQYSFIILFFPIQLPDIP